MRTLVAALTATLLAPAAWAQRFDCGSHDALLDAIYLPAHGARAAAVRAAVLSYCARATGRPLRYCAWVVPLVTESGCEIEFYRPSRDRPARAALGVNGERPEWAWHVYLQRTADGWRVTRLYYDDLEHP